MRIHFIVLVNIKHLAFILSRILFIVVIQRLIHPILVVSSSPILNVFKCCLLPWKLNNSGSNLWSEYQLGGFLVRCGHYCCSSTLSLS